MSGRARRRGGRGRRRPPRGAPPPRLSLWQRLLGALGLRRRPSERPKRAAEAHESQEAKVFREFAREYGVPFKDISLLKLALTHRSYLSVTGQSARESNERLEFLGDSVLGLVTSEFLYRRHPDEHEGQLTKIKSLLVSKAILSRRALKMGLGRYVLMSRSEVESGGRQRLSILADAFESVLGAIYLDQGFETARQFIHAHLLTDADDIAADKRHTNYKSHLQEYVQSTYRTHPVYRIRSEYGPDHSKYFMVEVMVGRRLLGEGRGHNKKEAEQAAARDAIERVTELRREASAGRRPEPEAEIEDRDDEDSIEAEEEEAPRRGRRRRGGRGRVRDAGGRAVAPVSLADREAEVERELEDDEAYREQSVRDPLAADREPFESDDDLEEDDDDAFTEDDAAFDPAAEDADGDPLEADDDDDDEDDADDFVEEPLHDPVAQAAVEPPRPVAPAVAFGRGRRGSRAVAAPAERAPVEPPAAEPEPQRHVDPFAIEEPGAGPGESAEAEPDKEALIEEMERAMENFGRKSRTSRRRR